MKTFYDYQEVARAKSAALMFVLSLAIAATTLMTGAALTAWIFVPTF